MSTARRTALLAMAAFAATLVWYSSRPCIEVTSDTLLWSTEYDASREASLYPGPGEPAGVLKAGSHLRVLWTAEGKDYLAYLVVTPHWHKGWVLFGQKGVAVPRVDNRGAELSGWRQRRAHVSLAFGPSWPGVPQPGCWTAFTL